MIERVPTVYACINTHTAYMVQSFALEVKVIDSSSEPHTTAVGAGRVEDLLEDHETQGDKDTRDGPVDRDALSRPVSLEDQRRSRPHV